MPWERSVCCLRVFLVIVTAILWLFGGGIFGFCLWVLLDFFINQYVQASDELKTVLVIVYVIIGVGVSLLIFGIIGIYGAARPRRWALITYLICLVCVTGVLLGGAIYCYVYRVQIKNSIQNSNLLSETVKKDYGSNLGVTRAFNYMQKELHCCGGVSYFDYLESNWITTIVTDNTDPIIQEEIGKNSVPLTCCKNSHIYENQPSSYQYCKIYQNVNVDENDRLINTYLYQTPCKDAIVKFLDDNILSILGLVLSITVFVILSLAIILTSALIHKLRRQPLMANNDDDVVYEMARSQEKSPYPTRGPYANLYNS